MINTPLTSTSLMPAPASQGGSNEEIPGGERAITMALSRLSRTRRHNRGQGCGPVGGTDHCGEEQHQRHQRLHCGTHHVSSR